MDCSALIICAFCITNYYFYATIKGDSALLWVCVSCRSLNVSLFENIDVKVKEYLEDEKKEFKRMLPKIIQKFLVDDFVQYL